MIYFQISFSGGPQNVYRKIIKKYLRPICGIHLSSFVKTFDGVLHKKVWSYLPNSPILKSIPKFSSSLKRACVWFSRVKMLKTYNGVSVLFGLKLYTQYRPYTVRNVRKNTNQKHLQLFKNKHLRQQLWKRIRFVIIQIVQYSLLEGTRKPLL